MLKAILLDFYGTLVEEDDIYINAICEDILENSTQSVTKSEVGTYWYTRFQSLCASSFGQHFQCQRKIELISLRETISHFDSSSDAEALSQILYTYWSRPVPFSNTAQFIEKLSLPSCIVSNIDTQDIQSALMHIKFNADFIVTSESARSYKPRSEMFEQALDLLEASPDEVIHIGDSYSSDVVGANKLGIPSIWINAKGRARSGSVAPTYDVKDILDLLPIIESLT